MSELEKFNDNALKSIMEAIYDEIPTNLEYLTDVIQNHEEIDEILQYFGLTNLDFPDYSYVCELFHLNSNASGEINLPLKRPKLKRFDVRHREDSYVTEVNYYKSVIDSYCNIDGYDLDSMAQNDFYDYWDGTIYDTNTINSEVENSYVESINQIK